MSIEWWIEIDLVNGYRDGIKSYYWKPTYLKANDQLLLTLGWSSLTPKSGINGNKEAKHENIHF